MKIGSKLALTLIGVVILVLVLLIWGLVLRIADATMWGLWFAAFTALIVQYSAANVVINSQASKDYRPELSGRLAAPGPPA